jgi:hypothetical protein
VALATYLTGLGFSPFEVGAIVTGTLLESAAVTLGVGLLGYGVSRKRVLLAAAALMMLTVLGFAGLTRFWSVMLVAVSGTVNPSSGNISLFLPTERHQDADHNAPAVTVAGSSSADTARSLLHGRVFWFLTHDRGLLLLGRVLHEPALEKELVSV